MRPSRYYPADSDPAVNWAFSRRWCEPTWVLRRHELLLGAAREQPPPAPDEKRRPGAAYPAHRPQVGIFKTNSSHHTQDAREAEAAQRARAQAEALFAQGGVR